MEIHFRWCCKFCIHTHPINSNLQHDRDLFNPTCTGRELYLCVCLGFFVSDDNFSFIWRRYRYRWNVANLDLRSALMAIEQLGVLGVPHLLLHGTSVYNSHLRGLLTLTHVVERLAVDRSVTTCFYDLGLSRLGFEHPTFCIRGERSNRLSHRCGVSDYRQGIRLHNA